MEIASKRPLVIFDGSHNPDGIATTVGILKELEVTPLTYVVGCMDDKDAPEIMRQLAPTAAKIICTQTRNKRALPAEKLAKIATDFCGGQVESFQKSESALECAFTGIDGRGMCVIGSLYLVGEAIPWWKARR